MLKDIIEDYIASKKALGYKFNTPTYLLRLFADYADQQNEQYIRINTVIDWASQAPSPYQRKDRLMAVRRLAYAVKSENCNHEVPPSDVFGRLEPRRKIRHIYSLEEVKALVSAVHRIKTKDPFRLRMFATLFTLMYATGIRFCEAVALDIEDLTDNGLMIKATKFRKDRIVSLHETTQSALWEYLAHRKAYHTNQSIFFISPRGLRLPQSTTYLYFSKAIGLSGIWAKKGNKPKPRVHDFRHTFIVNSIANCQGSYDDIHRHMAILSTYVGHSQVSNTYWYMHATSSLLQNIASAKERYEEELNHE